MWFSEAVPSRSRMIVVEIIQKKGKTWKKEGARRS